MHEAIVAAGSISGFVSLIGLLYVVFTKLGRMEVKICTLWRVYGEGVLEEAVKKGVGSKSSAIVITQKGDDLLNNKLKQKITKSVKRWSHKRVLFLRCPRCNEDLQHLVIGEVLDEVKNIANEKDIDINLMVATVMLYTEKVHSNKDEKRIFF